MCSDLLDVQINRIESDIQSLEFFKELYGNPEKKVLAKTIKEIEDIFFKFQDKWFWRKESEVLDCEPLLRTY